MLDANGLSWVDRLIFIAVPIVAIMLCVWAGWLDMTFAGWAIAFFALAIFLMWVIPKVLADSKGDAE